MNEKGRKTIQWSPEQRAQHQAIREAFRDWHPGPEELIASGAAARLGLDVISRPAQDLLRLLKASREKAGLTLAVVSARCGIDQPACLGWRTVTPQIRPWIRCGAMPRRSANDWYCPPRTSRIHTRFRRTPDASSRRKPRRGRRRRREFTDSYGQGRLPATTRWRRRQRGIFKIANLTNTASGTP